MAVVKMRELLREPKAVFDRLEKSGEPVLLTREGNAVAALFSVDSKQVEETALAALPEFVRSRERAKGARREGRTASAATVLDEFAARHGESDSQLPVRPPSPAAAGEAAAATEPATEVISSLDAIFGGTISQELKGAVEERIAAASEPVLEAAPVEASDPADVKAEFEDRVRELNSQLFSRLLPVMLRRTTRDVLVSGLDDPASNEGGVLGRVLAEQTLDAVATRVRTFNAELVGERLGDRSLSLPLYEAYVLGAQAMEHVEDVNVGG